MATRKTTTKKVELKDDDKVIESRLTTSKKVLWLSWMLFVVLIVLEVLGKDVSTSLEIVGGVVAAGISSVYMWKSKAENKLKISYKAINDLADKYGIENIISLLQNVLSD